MVKEQKKIYQCWLDYKDINSQIKWLYGSKIYVEKKLLKESVIQTAIEELKHFYQAITKQKLEVIAKAGDNENCEMLKEPYIEIEIEQDLPLHAESYYIKNVGKGQLKIVGHDAKGVLYGAFELIVRIRQKQCLEGKTLTMAPKNEIRMIDHWDNIDGSIERGYAGSSIFYNQQQIVEDKTRIKDYARLLASVGINSICINNVNVHYYETQLITQTYLQEVAKVAEIFRGYGIKLYLSINFAAPMQLAGLETADPLDEQVRDWWKQTAQKIYSMIPDFGGFLVKADSENRPGPFTYNRTHADGANMLAEAVEPYGGIVIWRCFVYNCHVDWRDRTTDRARAAYDHFKELDGNFHKNVILQIKNGPMDFQIREPISPLFGGMSKTNQMMEFQITQEYTGQQKHICFLVPMWKECLEFDTYAKGKGTFVKDIISGETFKNSHSGIAGVSNIGNSECWFGNPMAAANLFGFGKLCWNPDLSAKEIATEWSQLTLGLDQELTDKVVEILLDSRKAYEDYTVPLGIGWMVNVGHHYGPNIEGYEYSPWGTYHYADYKGIGVDRTMQTGTGYTEQYREPNRGMYEKLETCPEELLLFFHHVDYDYVLKDGRTLLQYIYDVHFAGVEKVEGFIEKWERLRDKVEIEFYQLVEEGLKVQLKDAKEWRDIVNTYFYRKTGIKDRENRKIYE